MNIDEPPGTTPKERLVLNVNFGKQVPKYRKLYFLIQVCDWWGTPAPPLNLKPKNLNLPQLPHVESCCFNRRYKLFGIEPASGNLRFAAVQVYADLFNTGLFSQCLLDRAFAVASGHAADFQFCNIHLVISLGNYQFFRRTREDCV